MEIAIIRAAQLILSLSLLIIMHECGHFLFAKIFKVRVERFYLFFNPVFSIFKMKKINGKWNFKFFAKNDTNIKKQILPNGDVEENIIPAEQLPDDNWKKYPESMEWGIGWIPLGGYVSLSGMIDESMNTAQIKLPAKPWEFRTKKAWQRLLIMTGGVLVNFIMALAIYSAVLFTWGETYVELKDVPMEFSNIGLNAGFENGDFILSADGKDLGRYSENSLMDLLEAKNVSVLRNGEIVELQMPKDGLIKSVLKEHTWFVRPFMPVVVDSTLLNSPAEKFLQKGDQFIKIDSVEIPSFGVLTEFLESNKEKTVNVSVLRNGEILTQEIPLGKDGKFGFYPMQTLQITPKTEHFNFFESIPAGISYGVNKLKNYVHQMKYVFTKEGATSLSGFVGMAGIFAPTWDWHSFWENTAFISIALAFLNILPIPALDGGHVLFLIYEVITRRKPSDKFMTYAQVFGMLLLFSLFFYANGMDLIRK
jgi:regulator of sigma E protease